MKRALVLLVFLITSFYLVFRLSSYLEVNRPPLLPEYQEEYLILRGEKLRDFCLGLNGLIADYYWMQVLQYLGNKIIAAIARGEHVNINDLSSLNPKMFYPLLDNVISFDPKFEDAYLFSSLVLSAIDMDKAIELTEKGPKNLPDDWRVYHYLGYIYWKKGEYDKASEIYERGSRVTNSPAFMRMMSAKIRSAGGSREVARQMYLQMYEETNSERIKQNLLLWLMWLDSLDERDLIRRALQNFKQKRNRCVGQWRELLPELMTIPESSRLRFDSNGVPYDPTGAPYVLDSLNCDVKLDVENTKLPLN